MPDTQTIIWLAVAVVTGGVAYCTYGRHGVDITFRRAALLGLCSAVAAVSSFVAAQRCQQPVLAYFLAVFFGGVTLWNLNAPFYFRMNARYLRRRDGGA